MVPTAQTRAKRDPDTVTSSTVAGPFVGRCGISRIGEIVDPGTRRGITRSCVRTTIVTCRHISPIACELAALGQLASVQDSPGILHHLAHDLPGRSDVVNQTYGFADQDLDDVEIVCDDSFLEGIDRIR